MTLAELSIIIGTKLRGNGSLVVTGVAPLGETSASELTFIADAGRLSHTLENLGQLNVAALIVPEKIAEHELLTPYSLLMAKDAKLAFARAIKAFHEKPYENRGVNDDVKIGSGSTLGADCSILPNVTIGRDCAIGRRVTFHPGVVLGDHCKVGDDTVIFANVAIYDDSEIADPVRQA